MVARQVVDFRSDRYVSTQTDDHEGGTGWLQFRALDQEGKVIYTIE